MLYKCSHNNHVYSLIHVEIVFLHLRKGIYYFKYVLHDAMIGDLLFSVANTWLFIFHSSKNVIFSLYFVKVWQKTTKIGDT